MRTMSLYCQVGKRIFDVSISVVLIVLFAPVVLVIGGLVLIDLGLPMIFMQVRPGYQGRPFSLLKFRTMKPRGGSEMGGSSDADRLTSSGRLLRRLSLDELPELLNVLRGDMSLVGPRPLLMEYLERYTDEQARRHEVKPGITGWAQVNGRNALSWNEKFEFDVWYVERVSLWLDLKILAMTIWQVVTGEGVSAEGHATMPKFGGTEQDER